MSCEPNCVYPDPELLVLLFDTGIVDANARRLFDRDEDNGWTALHLLSNTTIEVKEDDNDSYHGYPCFGDCLGAPVMIETFFEYADKAGIDLNVRDFEGRTPLHHICINRCEVKILIFLNDSRIDFNVTDNEGRTPLHLALFDNHYFKHDYYTCAHKCSDKCNESSRFLETLLKFAQKRNINLNAVDHQGRTPFHLMCMTRCAAEIHAFRQLATNLNCDFNFEMQDLEGKTPQDLTLTRDSIEIQRKINAKEREQKGFKYC